MYGKGLYTVAWLDLCQLLICVSKGLDECFMRYSKPYYSDAPIRDLSTI